MLLTSCLFEQAALSNHGRFKPDWAVSGYTHQHKFIASLAVYGRLVLGLILSNVHVTWWLHTANDSESQSNVGQKEDKILYNLTTKVSFTRIQIMTIFTELLTLLPTTVKASMQAMVSNGNTKVLITPLPGRFSAQLLYVWVNPLAFQMNHFEYMGRYEWPYVNHCVIFPGGAKIQNHWMG